MAFMIKLSINLNLGLGKGRRDTGLRRGDADKPASPLAHIIKKPPLIWSIGSVQSRKQHLILILGNHSSPVKYSLGTFNHDFCPN